MDIRSSKLFLLFQDAFMSNLLFSFNNEILVFIMLNFTKNKLQLLFVESLAFALAILSNYIFGNIFFFIYRYFCKKKIKNNYLILQNFFYKYGSFLCLLSCFLGFLGKFIPFLAGIVRYNLFFTITASVISKLIYLSLL